MHQVVTVVIIAMLTLCYSIMSHATRISLLLLMHVSTIDLLTIICTLVATSMILGRLGCTLIIPISTVHVIIWGYVVL